MIKNIFTNLNIFDIIRMYKNIKIYIKEDET